MLYKWICKKCVNKYWKAKRREFSEDDWGKFGQMEWSEANEEDWDKYGQVECFPCYELAGYTYADITQSPPKECLYAMEHMMAEQADAE